MPAKTLLFDVETAPHKVWVWQLYDANAIRVDQPMSLLSYAWKWYGDKEVNINSLRRYKSYKPGDLDDSLLTHDLWNLLDSADIIVGQNSDSYDLKVANTRFLHHKLPPPSTYQTFDTLKALKKVFRFGSNKQDSVLRQLGLGEKYPSNLDMWFGCMDGDDKSWELMEKYNVQDVVGLETLYELVRPWVRHPNVALFDAPSENVACPTCGSHHLQKRGPYPTQARVYQRYRCNDCFSWFKGALLK